ncbi:MAG TPA: endolytic transglycosylase MltG [Usitatibacter sp.]|nr:endolytic transglycosylase MltG [Usitatibacter sp.]
MRAGLLALLLVAGAASAWLAWFAHHPVRLPAVPYEFTVRPGSSLKTVSRELAAGGLFAEGESFWILGRMLRKAGAIRAGTYRLETALTPLEILDKLARGDVVLAEILFVEGTTSRQWLAELAANAQVRHTLAAKSEAEVAALLGIEGGSLEGWLFPDTYRFSPGSNDLDILRRAHAAMAKRLEEAWAGRDPDLPLASPYEALILASIVEKETAVPGERPLVASVFVNRLRRGMRLQTDPSVIYGMGERFDGNIRKKDLEQDTPWNTYTRGGLPPTPIAMPGEEALRAAVHPAPSEFLYFVGRGDGSHEFSRTLEQHNRAVARYQLHRASS